MRYHPSWVCKRQRNTAAAGMLPFRRPRNRECKVGTQQAARWCSGERNRDVRGCAKETQQGYGEDAVRLRKLYNEVAMGTQQE